MDLGFIWWSVLLNVFWVLAVSLVIYAIAE